ncbi:MAG: rRNA (cytidine-2'-O-)-methyltransferase, partial [Opitutaceae bacterium]|nr:rRNA (cytidine-2'-O-)-methyltransferase [Opitutaceae bacterium]
MPGPEESSTVNASLTPESGSLYVVATPLGNLADISKRAISILDNVSLIACEDTRVSGKLLSKLGIENRTVSYHDNNERSMAPKLAEELAQGKSIALISDAGTPGLSDPGFRLTRECRKQGIPVVPVPG